MVLVSHPHAASVANECAAALARRDLLSLYATGIAWSEYSPRAAHGWMKARFPSLGNRVVRGVEAELLSSVALGEVMARAAAKASLGNLRAYDAMFWSHDRIVACMRWPKSVRVVYAYEDGALATFERAVKDGVRRLWDLPAPHHRSRDRIRDRELRRWPGAAGPVSGEPNWKRRRKDRELALATAVMVASDYTATTVRAAGYEGPVEIVPYGFPVHLFPAKDRTADEPFTVLAVGSHALAKGTPYLLEAWRAAGIRGRLRLVGEMHLPRAFLDGYAGLFEHVRHVPRALLGEEYRRADIVVFPSLGDGFGLVIQEAMCSGTPVIATPCSGGPECITEGENGWIVPAADLDALVESLRGAARDRERLRAMGGAARLRAERWSWEHAGAVLADVVERLSRC